MVCNQLEQLEGQKIKLDFEYEVAFFMSFVSFVSFLDKWFLAIIAGALSFMRDFKGNQTAQYLISFVMVLLLFNKVIFSELITKKTQNKKEKVTNSFYDFLSIVELRSKNFPMFGIPVFEKFSENDFLILKMDFIKHISDTETIASTFISLFLINLIIWFFIRNNFIFCYFSILMVIVIFLLFRYSNDANVEEKVKNFENTQSVNYQYKTSGNWGKRFFLDDLEIIFFLSFFAVILVFLCNNSFDSQRDVPALEVEKLIMNSNQNQPESAIKQAENKQKTTIEIFKMIQYIIVFISLLKSDLFFNFVRTKDRFNKSFITVGEQKPKTLNLQIETLKVNNSDFSSGNLYFISKEESQQILFSLLSKRVQKVINDRKTTMSLLDFLGFAAVLNNNGDDFSIFDLFTKYNQRITKEQVVKVLATFNCADDLVRAATSLQVDDILDVKFSNLNPILVQKLYFVCATSVQKESNNIIFVHSNCRNALNERDFSSAVFAKEKDFEEEIENFEQVIGKSRKTTLEDKIIFVIVED